jgi:16S rRNA (uracil1498-N3)-methyltransferase
MQLFYEPIITEPVMPLSAENLRHVVQVLRMKINDTFLLTDGNGLECIATIAEINKKNCFINITQKNIIPYKKPEVNLAIAFTKNNNRMEWLLEKITEIGITNIYPLQTKRAEQLYLKKDRLQHILVSAMCQSKQYYLPILHDVHTIDQLLKIEKPQQKFIAHCIDNNDKKTILQLCKPLQDRLVLIGPEGDFTQQEIELCLQHHFVPVTLGDTRLRTETAGLVAVTLLNNL